VTGLIPPRVRGETGGGLRRGETLAMKPISLRGGPCAHGNGSNTSATPASECRSGGF
jgi:hypothetical protein